MVAILTGCGKLPAIQTDSFSKIAQADRTAFGATQAAQKAALQSLAIDQLTSGKGTLTYQNCSPVPLPEQPKAICANRFDVGGESFIVQDAAPKINKLIGAVANYGARMTELAAAKDLTDLNSKIDSVAAAIAAIGTATGVGAPAGPIAKAIALGVEGGLKEQRRKMLLKAALQAKPSIDRAADDLSGASAALKSQIAFLAGPRLATAQLEIPQDVLQLNAVEQEFAALTSVRGRTAERRERQLNTRRITLQQRVTFLTKDQFAATAQLQASREITTDFLSLRRGHDAIIKTLQSKKIDASTSFTELNSFVGDLKDLKAAL